MNDHHLPAAVRLASEKFDTEGRPRPMSGNTILWHLPKEHAAFKAMVSAQDTLAQGAAARSLALLPAASFHLTLLEGCLDRVRTRQAWPRELALDATMDEVNAFMSERLRRLRVECTLPIRLRFADPGVVPQAAHFEVVPVDLDEATKLVALRGQFAQALGLWHEDHDRYRFHVTVAYIYRELSAPERGEFEMSYRRVLQQLRTHDCGLELWEPEFCVFSDMTHFATQFRLAPRAEMMPVWGAV